MDVRIIPSIQTRDLRYRVLWPHKASIDECFIDIDDREDAFHLATFDGDRIVSVGSFFQMTSDKIESQKPYRLRAMATDPDYRGKGTGRLLIEKAKEILSEKEVDILWCDARIVATGFYSSLGFQMLPEPYEIPIIGTHYFMWLKLDV
jgi:GNAT superfamily N-acetyltransferase